MESLTRPTFRLPDQRDSTFPTRLDERRIAMLGAGARADRDRLREVCGGRSAANQWLDKASKEGLLVPVGWGEYQVVEQETLEVLRTATGRTHRRFVAWALTLPDTLHPDVAFLAPRLWAETPIAWNHPAPIIPFDGSEDGAPATLGVLGYSLHGRETWECQVGETATFRVRVPARVDATIVLGSNLDPRCQRASRILAESLGPSERLFARRQLARLRRFPGAASAPVSEHGPAVRTPRWWNKAHERAVEGLVRNACNV